MQDHVELFGIQLFLIINPEGLGVKRLLQYVFCGHTKRFLLGRVPEIHDGELVEPSNVIFMTEKVAIGRSVAKTLWIEKPRDRSSRFTYTRGIIYYLTFARMRRFIRTALLGLAILALPVSALALTTEGGKNILVSSSTSHDGVYAAGGGSVRAGGMFNNDVLIGGGEVTISGPVKGDVLVGGGSVTISGDVGGSVRVAGGDVEITSKVGRNVLVAGGTVTLGDTSTVTGEVTSFSGELHMAGHVTKSLHAWAGSVIVSGKVDGNVEIHTADDCGKDPCVTVGSAAVIGGNLTYWAATDAQIQTGAVISGKTVRNPVAAVEASQASKVFTGMRLWSLLSALLAGLLVAVFVPRTVRRVAATMTDRFWPSVGVGSIFFFLTPLGIILCLITLIGIPVGLIVGAVYAMTIYLSQIFLGYLIGLLLARWMKKSVSAEETKSRTVWLTLLGILVLNLVFDFILDASLFHGPFFLAGMVGIIRFGLLLWSLGALVHTKWRMVREHA